MCCRKKLEKLRLPVQRVNEREKNWDFFDMILSKSITHATASSGYDGIIG